MLLKPLAASVLVPLALAACSGSASVSVGTPQLSKQAIETQTADQLAAQLNQPKPTVTCPGSLDAKVGAAIDCHLVAQGSTTQLPVHIVVESINGTTAHFSISVGGAGDKTAFCNDNATIGKATSAASQPSDLIPVFKANLSTLDDFEKNAPADIHDDASTLAEAAKAAAASGNINDFLKAPVETAGPKVDAYCGQNPDGSPATTTTSTGP